MTDEKDAAEQNRTEQNTHKPGFAGFLGGGVGSADIPPSRKT